MIQGYDFIRFWDFNIRDLYYIFSVENGDVMRMVTGFAWGGITSYVQFGK
jgi:hypothetical protein